MFCLTISAYFTFTFILLWWLATPKNEWREHCYQKRFASKKKNNLTMFYTWNLLLFCHQVWWILDAFARAPLLRQGEWGLHTALTGIHPLHQLQKQYLQNINVIHKQTIISGNIVVSARAAILPTTSPFNISRGSVWFGQLQVTSPVSRYAPFKLRPSLAVCRQILLLAAGA